MGGSVPGPYGFSGGGTLSALFGVLGQRVDALE